MSTVKLRSIYNAFASDVDGRSSSRTVARRYFCEPLQPTWIIDLGPTEETLEDNRVVIDEIVAAELDVLVEELNSITRSCIEATNGYDRRFELDAGSHL
jgi:hypothetical protein